MFVLGLVMLCAFTIGIGIAIKSHRNVSMYDIKSKRISKGGRYNCNDNETANAICNAYACYQNQNE